MTSPYITPTIREDAAALGALLKDKRMTRKQIDAQFSRNKTALDRAFAHAKNLGLVAMARDKEGVWWSSPAIAHAIAAEVKQQTKEREAARERNRPPKYLDFDTVPDLPVKQWVIPALSKKAPATNAPRWIFEAA